ncbi:MAG: hypothetical protein ACLGG0_05535 [Bacteriovoracia bacterium]
MQKIVTNLLGFLPEQLALLPYHVAHFLVITIAKKLNIICWSRNSYHHKRIVPGISDLDFTVLHTNALGLSQLNLFLSFYHFAKKIIPILGEINIYRHEMIDLTAKWLNPFELRRDPKLKSHLVANPEDAFNRFTYLLRMLESDAKNLKLRASSRQKKWNFHLSEAGLASQEQLNPQELIRIISTLNPTSLAEEDVILFLHRYIQDGTQLTYSHLRTNRVIKVFMVLYPHRWLVHANGLNDVDICLGANSFDEGEVELILNQLQWELVGIQTQFSTKVDLANTLSYLRLIHYFLMNLKAADPRTKVSDLAKDIQSLINEINN